MNPIFPISTDNIGTTFFCRHPCGINKLTLVVCLEINRIQKSADTNNSSSKIEPIVLVHKLFKQMKTCTRKMVRVDRVWSCALSGVNQFCVECRRFEPRAGQVVVVSCR